MHGWYDRPMATPRHHRHRSVWDAYEAWAQRHPATLALLTALWWGAVIVAAFALLVAS